MSYQSEVVIKVYGSTTVMLEFKKRYDVLFNDLDKKTQDTIHSWIGADDCNGFDDVEDGGDYTFYADYINWSDMCPEVMFLNKVQQLAVTVGGNVEFARIGQKLADCEEITAGDNVEYRLRITRTLTGY